MFNFMRKINFSNKAEVAAKAAKATGVRVAALNDEVQQVRAENRELAGWVGKLQDELRQTRAIVFEMKKARPLIQIASPVVEVQPKPIVTASAHAYLSKRHGRRPSPGLSLTVSKRATALCRQRGIAVGTTLQNYPGYEHAQSVNAYPVEILDEVMKALDTSKVQCVV